MADGLKCALPADGVMPTTLIPGRYTVKDTVLWCEPAVVVTDDWIIGYQAPVAICNFPMNSSNILKSSTV